jgi:hypothetical protein
MKQFFGHLIISLCALSQIASAGVTYSYEQFRHGLGNEEFVLLRLEPVSNCFKRRDVCTTAGWLIDAIRVEHKLGDTEAGTIRALRIAQANRQRSFRFMNPKALEIVTPQYTCQELDEVRRALRNVSISSLRKQLGIGKGKMHQLYQSRARFKYRDAVAQVLLERGIPVGLDERTKSLEVP